MNHAVNPNVKLYKEIVQVGKDKQPMIAMYSCKSISKGEQLFWDYGIRDRDIPWTFYKREVSVWFNFSY